MNKQIRIADIQEFVARRYGLTPDDMTRRRRTRRVAYPRQLAMYLARRMTTYSSPRIGRCFNRDHTTILGACRKITNKVRRHELIARELTSIETGLRKLERMAA